MATLQQLPSGNWRILFYVDNLDGTRIRKSLTAPTRWEAEKMAEETQKGFHGTKWQKSILPVRIE